MNNEGKSFTETDAEHIDLILYGQFIKYDKLRYIMEKELSDCKDKVINVYIDVYQMLLPIYRFYQVFNPLCITSCVINMAIHYRNFFRKYGIYTNIFLVYSPTMSANNTRFYTNYNHKNSTNIRNNKTVSDMVSTNLGLLETIVPYLPDIFFKIGTVETSVIIYDIISKFANKGFSPLSVVVSNSQYAFQIPAINDKCYLFYKKRDRDGVDMSYSVNHVNALELFIAETRKVHIPGLKLDPSWLSGFMTLSGLPKRDVRALMNYKTALEVLNTIKNAYNMMAPDVLYETINIAREGKDLISITELANTFNCIDLSYQVAMYNMMPESQETSFLRQLENPEELIHINERYFKDNPMLLDKL